MIQLSTVQGLTSIWIQAAQGLIDSGWRFSKTAGNQRQLASIADSIANCKNAGTTRLHLCVHQYTISIRVKLPSL